MRPSQTKPNTEKDIKDDKRKADVFAESEGSTAYKLKKRREEQNKRLKEIMEGN